MSRLSITRQVDGLIFNEEFLKSSNELLQTATNYYSIDDNLSHSFRVKFAESEAINVSDEKDFKLKANTSNRPFQWISISRSIDGTLGAKITINDTGLILFEAMHSDEFDSVISQEFHSFVEESPRLPFQDPIRRLIRTLSPAIMLLALAIFSLSMFAISYADVVIDNSVTLRAVKLPTESESINELQEALKSTDANKKLDALINNKFSTYKLVNLSRLREIQGLGQKGIQYSAAMMVIVVAFSLIEKFLLPKFAMAIGKYKRALDNFKIWRGIILSAIPVGGIVRAIVIKYFE